MKKLLARAGIGMLLIALLSSGLLAFANFNGQAEATDNLGSKAHYMISLDDGTEMFSKNADHKTHAAAFANSRGVRHHQSAGRNGRHRQHDARLHRRSHAPPMPSASRFTAGGQLNRRTVGPLNR